MPLPAFNDLGDLPLAVHPATLRQIIDRLGSGSAQRIAVGNRLERIHSVAVATGHLARFVVFGSFVTEKLDPNDVDVFILMENSFDYGKATGEAKLLFHHEHAQAHFGASVFWSTRQGAFGGEQAMIEDWQVKREGGRRGIVEIVAE